MNIERSSPGQESIWNYVAAQAYSARQGRDAQLHAAQQGGRQLSIAIAREAGIDAGVYARAIAQRLNWRVWDQELLERIALRVGSSANQLAALDERHVSWIQESLVAFLTTHGVTQANYVHHLVETLCELSDQGANIVIGRGAAHIMPAETTLKVRLVAPLAQRVALFSRQMGITNPAQAARQLAEIDRERVRFAVEHFHKDPLDSANYDLVLNLAHLSVDDVCRLVLDCLPAMHEQTSATAGNSLAVA